MSAIMVNVKIVILKRTSILLYDYALLRTEVIAASSLLPLDFHRVVSALKLDSIL